MKKETPWFLDWFNEDYLHLYAYRDESEAKKHVNFLCKQLNLRGDERILDLACGSGRHTIAFGQLGYDITGIDTSEFLIREAINNSQDIAHVKFLCRDMREISEFDSFDLIISMFTSFGYFESDKENQQVLDIISQALKPGGNFFMDYLYTPNVAKNLVPCERVTVKGEEVVITRKIEGDRVVKTIEFPGRCYRESVKLYDPKTISDMLEKAGLTIVNQWADYEATPLTPSSERLLTLSIK